MHSKVHSKFMLIRSIHAVWMQYPRDPDPAKRIIRLHELGNLQNMLQVPSCNAANDTSFAQRAPGALSAIFAGLQRMATQGSYVSTSVMQPLRPERSNPCM